MRCGTLAQRLLGAAIALASAAAPAPAIAADCGRTSTGLVPLTDLGTESYLDHYEGGLYPGGNEMPGDHRAAGLARAAAVTPRNATGLPASDGKVVMLSVGMSNTDQEWCFFNGFACHSVSFTAQALADPAVDQEALVIANGAAGGQTAPYWTDPDAFNYTRVREQVLAPAGLTPAQVQVAWVKLANGAPDTSLPDPAADAFVLEAQIATVLRSLRANYPNLAIAFLSSRIYAGYADTTLNPEPYAYETGFSVKWLIEAQIRQMRGQGVDARAGDLDYTAGTAPWLAWGPYLWADGTSPRSDGLTWSCGELSPDGTHPSNPGRQKVGAMLLEFFLGSEIAAPWFRAPEPSQLLLAIASGAALGALARSRQSAQSRGRRNSV